MPSAAKLSLDLLFGVLSLMSFPSHTGTVYAVMITDQGVIDGGTVEMSGESVTFFDGMGDKKSKVMSLVAETPGTSRYRYEHKTEPPREVVIDELVLNRTEFNPKTADQFRFRMVDGGVVQYFRVKDVIYLHLEGSANTIVLQK